MSVGLTRRTFLNLPNSYEPSKYKLDILVVTITPELAATWLTFNRKNRSKKPKFIKKLVRQILRDHFGLNGETIIFSSDGFLLDGQNRLHAIVLAGKPVKCLVVYGIEPDLQKTIDTGNQRTVSDTLVMEGESNSGSLATAIKTLYAWINGRLGIDSTPYVDNVRSLDILNAIPELRDSVTACRCTRDIVSQGVAAGLHVIFSQEDRTLADQFMKDLGTGENIARSNPAYKLREAIIGETRKMQRGKQTVESAARSMFVMDKNVQRAWIIKAWNAYRIKRKRIEFTADDVVNFPDIQGVPTAFIDRCEQFDEHTEEVMV
jgi:hypothetical protein